MERLEALRGIAAFWVAIGHSIIWLNIGSELAIWGKPLWEVHGIQARIARWLLTICNGSAAVDIFFVLSGFVLARSIQGKRLSPANYLNFIVRRLFRIVPAFWFSLALVVLYLITLFPGYSIITGASPWFQNWYQDSLSFLVIFKNATLQSSSLNPNTWTLSIEMVASLLLPFMVFCIGQCSAIRSIATIAALFAIALHDSSLSAHFAYMFAVGAVINSFEFDQKLLRIASSPLFTIACMAAMFAANASDASNHSFPADVTIVVATSALIWAINGKADNRIISILDASQVRFVGRISYSFYLLHFIVLYSIANTILHRIPTEIVLRWPLPIMLATCAISIAIALPVAVISFKFIEVPFSNFGRRLLAPRFLTT